MEGLFVARDLNRGVEARVAAARVEARAHCRNRFRRQVLAGSPANHGSARLGSNQAVALGFLVDEVGAGGFGCLEGLVDEGGELPSGVPGPGTGGGEPDELSAEEDRGPGPAALAGSPRLAPVTEASRLRTRSNRRTAAQAATEIDTRADPVRGLQGPGRSAGSLTKWNASVSGSRRGRRPKVAGYTIPSQSGSATNTPSTRPVWT